MENLDNETIGILFLYWLNNKKIHYKDVLESDVKKYRDEFVKGIMNFLNGVEFEWIGAVYIETSDEQFYLTLTVAQPFYDYKIEIKYKNLKYFSVKNKVIFDKKKYDLKKVKKVEKIDM